MYKGGVRLDVTIGKLDVTHKLPSWANLDYEHYHFSYELRSVYRNEMSSEMSIHRIQGNLSVELAVWQFGIVRPV